MWLSRLLAWWKSALVALVALLGAAYLVFGGGGAKAATLTVHRADVERAVAITGSVKAASEATLGFAESGRLSGTFAAVGQHVAKGALLAQIENGDEQAALAKAEANLDAALTGTRPEEVTAAEASLVTAIRSAYSTADDAVRNRADVIFSTPEKTPHLIFANFADLKNKLEKERAALNTTLPEWRDSLAALDNSNAAEAATHAEATLTSLETFLDHATEALTEALPGEGSAETVAADQALIATGRANVAAALTKLVDDENDLRVKEAGSTPADIAAARAGLSDAQAALAKTLVRAPFAGVVTRMDAKVGEIVSPADQAIALASDGLYEIEVYIPEIAIADVAVGESATTTLDAYGPEVPFEATVIAVDPAETVKDGVPTYKTTLAFSERDTRIRSGMTAAVSITTGTLVNAIVIPAGALGHDSTGAYVSVKEGSKALHRAVTLGETPSLGLVEVTTGLADGETIYLAPR